MGKNNYFQNAIINIAEFYRQNYNENNAEEILFNTLNKIIPFSKGIIYLQSNDKTEIKYQYGNIIGKEIIQEELSINGCKFGYIELSRESSFCNDEKLTLKTCAYIIANIIKDIELSKIVKSQVTVLQKSMEDAKKQNKKIIAAEKVKNNFLSNVSHELRTPLNSILGFSELLQAQFIGKLNKKQMEYISDIRIASLHLLGMINEILDMSKIEANAMKINLTEFKLIQNTEEVINILKPLYQKKNITLFIDIPQNITIKSDYQKIQQILFNIINNAIKFTPENGEIKIIAKNILNNLTIKIIDNGIGIEKKYLKRIFKKFMQVNIGQVKENSTGLGLTITKELVKLLNGEIDVESELNKGSTFIIKLKNIVIL